MTIQATPSEISYATDGVSTVFAIPFPFDTAADLKLTSTDASGNILTLSTGFAISGGAGSTGNATFSPAPAAGLTLTIYDNPALTQPTDYVSLDAFPAESHERALDRVTRIAKRLYQLVQRSVRFPDGDVSTDGVLGSVANRKGKYLFFNAITGAIEYAANIVTTTLSQSIIGQLLNPQITAEVVAGVVPTNYFYAPYDIRRYGADSTGVAASDTAMTRAIAVCGATGGTIRAPAGIYTFASAINLNSKTSITILGDGTTTAGGTAGTRFNYTGTGTGAWMTWNSAYGVKLIGIQLTHTLAGFTGTYIQCNNISVDPAFCGIYDCTLGGALGTGTTHLNLDKCINFTAERCNFLYGNPSVQGQAHAGSSYSNVNRFRDCHWASNYVAPIQDLGQGWTFEGCNFEQLTTGAPGALATNPFVTFASGLTVTGCWFGDATATVGTWISGYYVGSTFGGNYFSGNAVGSTCFSLSAPSGVVVKGNTFNVFLVGINFAAGGGGGHGNDFSGNFISGVVTWMTNSTNTDAIMAFNLNSPMQPSPNAKQGVFAANGMEVSPNGIIRQWGFASFTASGQTVTFPVAFTSNCWNVTCTLSGVGSTANTIYPSSVTTTNFVATIGGAFTNPTTFYWQAIGN